MVIDRDTILAMSEYALSASKGTPFSRIPKDLVGEDKGKPHILILVEQKHFPPSHKAASSRIHSLARYWSNLAYVTVVTHKSGNSDEGYSRIAFPLTGPRMDFLKLPSRFPKLLHLVRGLKVDVIFASFPPTWQILEGYLLSRRLGCPLVVDIRDLPAAMFPLKEGSFVRRIFNLSMRFVSYHLFCKASRIATVTDWLRKELIKTLSYRRKPIFLIPNGSDVRLFEKALRVKKEFDLVYSGTLIPVRNPVLMLKFLHCLRDIYPRLKLLFLSDILETALGSQFILGLRQFDLSKNVEFERMTSLRQIPDYLGKARLGIDSLFPEVYSHKGVASAKDYEYLAAGLPVVGLLDPGFYVETKRLILDNGAGIIDPDPESLARKTVDLLKDPARLREMSKRAREVGMRFDRKRLAEEYYYNVILPAWREFNARQSISDF
ncbi:MAG: hypothetical protein E3J71_05175 [Candidatus Stahlbacteria bacterium]|nr:MAG: hypothetical protein E3J71_05175 [Candidatus Stahlbacteria bacterium]